MVARKKQAARVKTTRKKATSRKSPRERAQAALDDSLGQLEKRLPKNLASVARDLRRNLKEFQRQIVGTMAHVPQVMDNIRALRELRADSVGVADTGNDARLTTAAILPDRNAALEVWKRAA